MTASHQWDTRVVWNVRHGRWWWNAWQESTATELWGFADSPMEAVRTMTTATQRADSRVVPIPGTTKGDVHHG